MEKAAEAGVKAGVRWELVLGCCATLASALSPVQAQEAVQKPVPVVVADARAEPPMRVQVQTSSLPRFDAQDAGFQAPRVDLTVTPLSSNGSGLGAVLGMAGPAATPQAQALGLQARPSFDLGLRWTQRLQSQRQVDITAWRRMITPDDAYSMVQMRQPVYGARVEMNLTAPRKTSFATDLGFVGLQLESGARITIKRKEGRPMVYYRTSF